MKSDNELHQAAFSVNGNMSGKKVQVRAIHDDIILAGPDYTVKRIFLNHGIISVGYAFEENHTLNIQKEKLAQSGFQGGPWIQSLKEAFESGVHTKIEIDGSMVHTSELSYMIETNPGIKIVYVTDFLWDEDTQSRLPEFAKYADILYCEAAYKDEDFELAKANYHMTDSYAEELGRLSKAKKLVKFHRSERYGE